MTENTKLEIVVRIGDSYLKREDGEIIETVETLDDGSPDWDFGTIADARGGGGTEGFLVLSEAFDRLERNAELLGS